LRELNENQKLKIKTKIKIVYHYFETLKIDALKGNYLSPQQNWDTMALLLMILLFKEKKKCEEKKNTM